MRLLRELLLILWGLHRVEDPAPRVLFASGDAQLAERVDEHLVGFGER